MPEEQDSRTATLGRKRALDVTPTYDLVTSSDSSDGEPAHKRLKQTSPTRVSLPTKLPSRPVSTDEQKEYIPLLDSDDPDSEEYALAEPGNVPEVEAADNAPALDASLPSQSQRDADARPSDESTSFARVQSQDDFADDEFVSAEADSIEDGIPAVQGSADATTTISSQGLQDEDRLGEPAGSSGDIPAAHTSATRTVNIVHTPGAADRTAMSEGRRIHIGRLPKDTTVDHLLALFKDYEVESVYIPVNNLTKKHPGYGFVCLPSAVEAQKAVVALAGKLVLKNKVTTKLSQGMIPAVGVGDNEVIGNGTKTVKQAASIKDLPSQPIAMGNESNSEIGNATDRPSLGNPKTKPSKLSKQEEKLRSSYGDEYITALHLATSQRSVHPIQLSSNQRSFRVGNKIVRLPEMMVDNSPIPLSELCLATFITPLLRENPEAATFFLTKPVHILQAFTECVRVQYRHTASFERKAIMRRANEYNIHTVSAQVAGLMASSMPEALKAVVQIPDFSTYHVGVRQAVYDGLEMLESSTTKTSEKEKPALDHKTPTVRQEFVVVAETELPKKTDPDSNLALEDSAKLPLRYVSDLEESNLLIQDAAPNYDIQSESQLVDDAEDEVLQMRYFPPSQHSYGPRCITCGDSSHPTSKCPPVTCKSCGLIEVHHTKACPQKVRCERCLERGHMALSCPEKLKRSGAEPMKCEQCGSLDHVESACHQVWRSYVAPLTARKVAGLIVNCSSCGSNDHFGMDCFLRPKTRVRASSTFSMDDAQQYIDPSSNTRSLSAGKDYSIKRNAKDKSKEFSIRGRARQDPINLDSDGDDGDFLHPPAQRIRSGQGHIHINHGNGNMDRFQNPPQSVSQNFARDPMPQTYQPQYPRARERSPPVYHDYRGGRDRTYLNDHYDSHDRYYNEQRPVDRYEGRFDAPYQRDTGVTRGGKMPRGGNTSKGGNTARGGNVSSGKISKNRKHGKRGSARGRGS